MNIKGTRRLPRPKRAELGGLKGMSQAVSVASLHPVQFATCIQVLKGEGSQLLQTLFRGMPVTRRQLAS